MIADGETWHYLALKKFSALFRGITSNNNWDFYCINCLRSYRTENYNAYKNYEYCYVEIPKKDNKTLKYNHGEKSLKVKFIIYADLELLLEKLSTCHNNPEKSSTTKISKHKPSGYLLFTNCSFDLKTGNFECYRGKDCMERSCKGLRQHATKIINYEKKEMKLLTYEKNNSYKKQRSRLYMEKRFSTDGDNKKYHEVRDYCHYTGKYRGAAHNICNLRYKTPKEIPIVFHNSYTYDYHFMIKELPKEFEGQFECLAKNTEVFYFSSTN